LASCHTCPERLRSSFSRSRTARMASTSRGVSCDGSGGGHQSAPQLHSNG
jgi:hypothetical protein